MNKLSILLIITFLFILAYKRTSKLAKIYLDPFAKFLDRPQWQTQFLLGTISLSGLYKDRKVTCTYRADKRGASVRVMGYPIRLNTRAPWYRYLFMPLVIPGFQVYGKTVVTSERVNYWGAPNPKSTSECQIILDELVLACEKAEKMRED